MGGGGNTGPVRFKKSGTVMGPGTISKKSHRGSGKTWDWVVFGPNFGTAECCSLYIRGRH